MSYYLTVLKEAWNKIVRVEAGSSAGLATFLIMAMLFITVLSLIMGSWPIALAFWIVFGLVALIRATVIERAGNALIPKGGSTPSVAQHSDIESLAVRGKLKEAAEAYRAVIAAEPADIVACEKLGQLALRELKDFETAVFAYREADQRSAAEPKRQLGYALLVAGIYRDNLKDHGRAMVELRKVLTRFPDAPNAARLRQELDEMKAQHFEAQ